MSIPQVPAPQADLQQGGFSQSSLDTAAVVTGSSALPAAMRVDHEDHTFRCESCGYSLEGIEDHAGSCPECGSAITSSLPAARTGSAWQIRAGPATWWATHKGTIRHPWRRFRTMRIEPKSWKTLLWSTLPVAGFFLVAPWTGTLVGDPARAARGSGPFIQTLAYLIVIPLQAMIAALVLFALTWIEWRGIRFFAKSRGWRLTRDAAWQVCSHASVGWVIGALIPIFTMAVLWAAPGGRPSLLDRLLARGGGLSYSTLTTNDAVLLALVLGAYGAGLLVFELLVYVGVRQCRWANLHEPAEPTAG